jgi:uncharacterized protein (TIGR03067 family)
MRSFRVTMLALAVAALTGCGKKAETGAPSGAGGDRDKLQGTWAIENVEDADGHGLKDPEEIKRERFTFEGDKLTNAASPEVFTFALDETANPKTLTLSEVVKEGTARPPETIYCIYKFDGDKLILAMADGTKATKPPTEFKAMKSRERDGTFAPGVSVLTLKKTDAPPPPARPRYGTTSIRPVGTKK